MLINDNDENEFSESDEKDEQVFYKVVLSISCYLFQEFQCKAHPHTISFDLCSGKSYYCFLLLVIVFPLADRIFISCNI